LLVYILPIESPGIPGRSGTFVLAIDVIIPTELTRLPLVAFMLPQTTITTCLIGADRLGHVSTPRVGNKLAMWWKRGTVSRIVGGRVTHALAISVGDAAVGSVVVIVYAR